MWLLAESEHAYVLKCYIYIYEGAKYDKSSGIAGAGYNVVYGLMEMGKSFDNCHYLFTDNLFATCAAANYLLEQGTFMTGTMRQNQLKHMTNETVTAKLKVGEKVYYRKERYFAMSYQQKQSQNKSVIMLSTFWGI